MSKDEFIDFVYTMHLQNTNGRESHDEMFKLGIGAAYDEMPVDYDKLVKINKLLRELLRENETDLKNIGSAQGVWHSSKDGGSYCL